MKNRRILTYALCVVILVFLAAFLVVEFTMHETTRGTVLAIITLLVAVASVACVEILFPVLDNRDMLKNKKYVLLVVVKTVLFLAAAACIFLYEPLKVIQNMLTVAIAFVVIYFAQFFISLDPKVKGTTEEEDDEDETEEIDIDKPIDDKKVAKVEEKDEEKSNEEDISVEFDITEE